MIKTDIGDYCVAHTWAIFDYYDPWAVGFLKQILITKSGTYYMLEGENVPERWFKHCRKITKDEGNEILAKAKEALLK